MQNKEIIDKLRGEEIQIKKDKFKIKRITKIKEKKICNKITFFLKKNNFIIS